MKISKDLPGFEKESALLLVAGKHSVTMYLASDGRIEGLESFQVLHPTYSDHEGFAQLSGHGMVFRHNFLSELQENATIDKFLRDIREHLKKHIDFEKPDVYYIYSPKFLSKEMLEVLPKNERENIKEEFLGNFVKSHPFELLEMIKKRELEKYGGKVPVSEETRKILRSDL